MATPAPMEPSAPAPADPGPPRRRRRWLWLLVLPVAALLLFVVFLLLLPRMITGERVRDELVSALTARLGVPVEIGAIEYGLHFGVVAGPIRVGPPPGYTRDLLRAERLALRYDLSGLAQKEVVVEEVTLDQVVVVLEKKDGRSGLDVVLAKLAEGGDEAPTAKAEPSGAPTGPLSPLTVVLKAVRLGPVAVELVGEGPNLKAHAATLTASGKLTPERLAFTAALDFDAAQPGPNVEVEVPGPDGGTQVALRFSEHLALAVDGKTSLGLALERVALDLSARAELTRGQVGKIVLPVGQVSLGTQLLVEPAQDRLRLAPLSAKFGEAPILEGHVAVDGLAALLRGQLGALPAKALADQLGVVERQTTERVELVVDTLAAPLSALAPYASAFVPGLSVGGRVAVEGLRIEGPVADFLAGSPPVLEGAIRFEGVAVTDRASGLSLARLDGALHLARGEGPEPYTLGGRLELGPLVAGSSRVGAATVVPSLALTRLAYPLPERSRVGLGLDATRLEVPGTTIQAVKLEAQVAGPSLLTPGRNEAEPISTRVQLGVEQIAVAQPNGALTLPKVDLVLEASLDRLVEPAEQPVKAQLSVSVPRYQDPAGNLIEGVKLKGPLTLGDPRRAYFDVQGSLQLLVASINTPSAIVRGLNLTLEPNVRRIGAQPLSTFFGGQPPPAKLPAVATLGLQLVAEEVVSGQGDDRISTRPELKAKLNVDLLGARAKLESLRLSLDDWLTTTLEAKVDGIYEPSPHLEATARIERLALAGAVAHAPKSALVAVPDLEGLGTLDAQLEVRGRVPQGATDFDPERPPMEGQLALGFHQVGVRSAQVGHALTGLEGRITAALARRKVELDAALDTGPFRGGQGEATLASDGASLRARVGLEGELLTGRISASTRQLQIGDGARPPLPGARIEGELSYPKGDDLELKRLELELPMAGVSANAWGQLKRQDYGVFRPDLSLELRLDIDTLKSLAARIPGLEKSLGALSQTSGRVETHLELASRSATRVDVHGMVRLARFSYEAPGLVLTRATGQIPLDQALLLPPPSFDPRRAEATGSLGDDLEARLDELANRFKGAKVMVASENILQVAPRTADHPAIQPYYGKRGAELVAERLLYKQTELTDLKMEWAWDSGVLRVDRLQANLWDGSFLGDMALQLSPDLDVRMRMRGVATRLNLDIPYAQARGLERVTDPDDIESYRATATMDLAFGLRERAISGNIDVLEVSLPQVERLFGAVDPKGNSPAVGALGMSEVAGVRPVAAKIWIAQNLLSVQFDWQRLWLPLAHGRTSAGEVIADAFLTPLRMVAIPTLGGLYIIPLVNNAIRRVGIGNVLDSTIAGLRLESYPALAQGWVIARDEESGEPVVASP